MDEDFTGAGSIYGGMEKGWKVLLWILVILVVLLFIYLVLAYLLGWMPFKSDTFCGGCSYPASMSALTTLEVPLGEYNRPSCLDPRDRAKLVPRGCCGGDISFETNGEAFTDFAAFPNGAPPQIAGRYKNPCPTGPCNINPYDEQTFQNLSASY